MAPSITVALIQFQPKPLSPEENFQYASTEIQKAATQGAHIAVLPEYHLTSWVPSHPDFVTSCTASTAYLAQYQALARTHNIHIVPGTIVTPVSIPSITANLPRDSHSSTTTELHNIAHFIEATTGSILSSYQKRNLWYVERGVLTAGKAHISPHKAFPVPITFHLPSDTPPLTLRVGLLICWDLAFPEAARELIVDGAELLIIPAYWHITQVESDAVKVLNPMSEAVFLDSVVVARAFENTCAVALCNAWGRSQVAVPVFGGLEESKMAIDEIGTRVVEVNLEVLRVAEEHYKLRADLQGGGGYGGL